ncbi:MAG: hypothetical protein EAZ57_11595 [Cytophagales bacterium]|nr:MAG: hypothetical protein EAZ67_12630 [Cytophagales bacterium]TAF59293.1 MAG: hypothetical protein EAZ57_11595 [Cytophagales bacterium]
MFALKSKNLLLCLSICVTLFAACSSKRVYDDYQSMPDLNVFWPKADVKTFDINIEQGGAFNGFLVVRHSFMIGISNIPVETELTSPSGKKINKTHQVALRNAEGKVIGEAIGETTDLKFALPELSQLDETGTYKFTVRHISEMPTITGITQVGIELDKQ